MASEAHLPSYEEAVTGGHWLDLVAPYVSLKDYSKLCRVSRRFYDQFAPRLWNDPLQTARLLGLHPNDDLQWFIYFVTRHAKAVRDSTRRLVVSLDFRAFAADIPTSIAGTSGRGGFSETLRLIATYFPAVRCILLGGNGGYDPSDLGHPPRPDDFPEDGSHPMPLILDVERCGMHLPSNFFHPSYWRQLAYLDMSDVPGSLKGIIKTGTFNQGALPHLRILKLRGRELDDASLAPIAEHVKQRVWSLDLSNNKLTDGSVHSLFHQCFGTDDLTAHTSHYEVEGKLATMEGLPGEAIPPRWRGWVSYIVESSTSGTFSHPDRYLADAPVYGADNHNNPSISRLAGNEPLRRDRVQDVKKALAGGPGKVPLDWHHVRDADVCMLPPSLTHLYLSGNRDFTVEGVESLFRCSRGHIQHFDCASPAIPTYGQVPFTLNGIIGRSHLFRPVVASNLRSLRVHHSIVTNIPTLNDPTKSPREALVFAETVLRERAEFAYPLSLSASGPFGPDWNPRLESLTLAGLPRVSTGPLIDSLIRFLVSAGEQEAAVIASSSSASLTSSRLPVQVSRRGPTMLRGLRHLRLEFEPYPPQDEDLPVDGTFASLDAKALLNSGGERKFSFFGETRSAETAASEAITEATTEATPKLFGDRIPEKENLSTCTSGNGSGSSRAVATASTDSPASPDRLHLGLAPEHTVGQIQAADENEYEYQPGRLQHYPLSGSLDARSEYVREVVSLGEHKNDGDGDDDAASNHEDNKKTKMVQLSVWVGTGRPGANRAVNAYMANLSRPLLRRHIRPATPDQVAAGVPMGACVYNAAWDAILWLPVDIDMDRIGKKSEREGGRGRSGHVTATSAAADDHGGARLRSGPSVPLYHSPTTKDPRRGKDRQEMRDVVDAIRQFRAATRTGIHRPSGLVEVVEGDPRGVGRAERGPVPPYSNQRAEPTARHWTGSLEVLLAS